MLGPWQCRTPPPNTLMTTETVKTGAHLIVSINEHVLRSSETGQESKNPENFNRSHAKGKACQPSSKYKHITQEIGL